MYTIIYFTTICILCIVLAIVSFIGATRVCYGAHSYAIAISWFTSCMHSQIRSQKKVILVFSKQYMDQSACQVHALVSIPASTTNYHVDRHASSAELANMFIIACSPFQVHHTACLLCVDIHETHAPY